MAIFWLIDIDGIYMYKSMCLVISNENTWVLSNPGVCHFVFHLLGVLGVTKGPQGLKLSNYAMPKYSNMKQPSKLSNIIL